MTKWKLAALITFAAVCAVVVVSPETFAVHAAGAGDYSPVSLFTANAVLLALRTEQTDLIARATAKLAEVKDGMAPEAVRQIEADHADLLRQVDAVKVKITAEETRSAPQTAHAWLAADIGSVVGRAVAFGLTAADATAVMADTNIRSVEAATDALQAKAAAAPNTRQNPHRVEITRDAAETMRTAVESSIILRANPRAIAANAPEREMARNYRGMSLLEVGRVFTEETTGERLRGLDKRELATRLLGLDTRAGMHSTSDFANLLANVAARRLRNAYEVAPQNWKKLGRQSNNPDFKEKSVVQLSSAPAFKKVREGGEFSYGGLTDGVEKYALSTYGRIIAITRQTLINDDLGAFDRLPTMLGRQAAELEANTFWSVLTLNAAMHDGTALFHADHGNLLAATAINEIGLTAAKKAMRKQKSLSVKAADREPMNLVPAFLVCSPDKEVEAQKMLSAVVATAANDVNVFASSMELIVEARLDGNGWFTSADPALIDTIEYSYLEGEEGVFTEQRIGFQVDGIEVKGRLDFAAKAIDWRGMTYNPGA